MQNYVIITIVVIIAVVALLRVKKHFKGGCCGSAGGTIRDKKTLPGPKLGEKVLTIEGMHCVNCEIRVENALNHLEHAACHVNLKKKNATVSYSAEIPDEVLRQTVEKLGYQVTKIQ